MEIKSRDSGNGCWVRSHPNEAARAPGQEKPGHAPWDYGNTQNPAGGPHGYIGLVCYLIWDSMWRMRSRASLCVRWLEKGETGEVGGQEGVGCCFWMKAAEHLGMSPCAFGLGQFSLRNPSRHMENGVMKQRSEDWVSLLLLCHIRLVPAEEPARDTSTGKAVREIRLTREALTRSGEKRKLTSTAGEFCAITPTYPADN